MRRPCAPALTAVLATALLGAAPLAAGVDRWTAVGPAGGEISILAADPADSRVLYAGSRWGGLFKSLDGGRRWIELAGGLPVGEVRALAIDPLDRDTLYVSVNAPGTHGFYASADGGRRFSPLGPPFLPFLLAVPTGPPGVVYAVGPMDQPRSCAFACLVKSTDGGESWQPLLGFASEYEVRSLLLHPERPEEIHLGVFGGVWRSTDGGESWTLVEEDVEGLPLGTVLALGRAPSAPETVYAALQERVASSTDGGATWRGRGELPIDCAAEAVVVAPDDPETAYVYCGSGLLRSRDGGATWDPLAPELPVDYYLQLPVDPLLADPARPGVLYAATQRAGIFRSDDGGDSWRPASAGIRLAWVRELAFHPWDPARLYALTRTGVEHSRDGGRTWRRLGTLPDPGVPAFALAVDPRDSDRLFLGHPGGLFRSTDGGGRWRRLPVEGSVEELTVDRTGSRFYAGGTGGLHFSSDRGGSWRRVLPHWIREIDLDPADPRQVYARAQVGTTGMWGVPVFRTFRSRDHGESWSQLDRDLFGLQIAPGDPSTLYWNGERSRDGGETWEPVPFPAEAAAEELLVVPSRPAGLYTRGPGGVFRSLDLGDSWELINLPEQRYHRVELFAAAAHPLAPERLYSFPPLGGLYALQPLGAAPLLLRDGRFEVRSAFRDLRARYGAGQPLALTGESGAFAWRGVVQAVAKVLDGRGANGHFWTFAAGLSNFEATLTVLDRAEGTLLDLVQPAGPPQSLADLRSFPPLGESPGDALALPAGDAGAAASAAGGGEAAACTPGPATLCLVEGRFRAEVTWRGRGGAARPGRALPITGDAGAFSFAAAGNLEVAVRMVDGRRVNGRFWLFAGGLSSRAYTLTVTDLATGDVRRYDNPRGTLASRADFEAFPPP